VANIELLDGILADVDAKRFTHNPAVWFQFIKPHNTEYTEGSELPPCGTACCVAGGIAWKLGWRPVLEEDLSCTTWARPTIDGLMIEVDVVDEIACKALDIDWPTAKVLFAPDNTRELLGTYRTLLAFGARLERVPRENGVFEVHVTFPEVRS